MKSNIGDSLAPSANNLSLLRLAAAIAVLVSHCALLKIGVEEAEPLAGLMAYSLSDHALHAFFFISGLTIAASLSRATSYWEFVIARILRIWPALMVATLILALCVGPILGDEASSAYFMNAAWLDYIRKASLLSAAGLNLPGLFTNNPHLPVANGSPWTLKYEVICYGLIAICAVCAGGRDRLAGTRLLAISTAAALVLMLLMPAGLAETLPGHLARFWFAFGLGALSWQFAGRLRPSLLLVALAGACLWLFHGGALERPLSIVFTGVLVLYLAVLPTGHVRNFTNRVDLSYGVYVTAWPITQTIVAFFPKQPLVIVTIVTLLMSIMFAFASWFLVEKPAMSLRGVLVRLIRRFHRIADTTPRDLGVAPPKIRMGQMTRSSTAFTEHS